MILDPRAHTHCDSCGCYIGDDDQCPRCDPASESPFLDPWVIASGEVDYDTLREIRSYRQSKARGKQ